MKYSACIVVLYIVSAIPLFSQSPIYFSAEEIEKNTAFFSDCYPRFEGSEGEHRALAYIQEELTLARVPWEIQDFSEMEGGHSFSQSLSVTLKGKLDDTLLCIFPLNHPADETHSSSGAVNLAFALGFIKACSLARELPVTVQVLFLGAEFQLPPQGDIPTGVQPGTQLGTRLFLGSFYPSAPATVLYFNFKDVPSRILFKTGTRGEVAPYWLIRRLFTSISDAEIPFTILGNQNQIFRMGLADTATLLDPYLKAGYPGVMLEGEYTAPGASGGTAGTGPSAMERSGWFYAGYQFLFRFLESGADGFPGEWDRHYLFFQLRDKPVIIPEKSLLLLYLVILTLPLLYIVLAKKRFVKYLINFLKYSYTLIIFAGLIFFFLFLATEVLRIMSGLRNFPDLWKYTPYLMFILKISIALSLFFPFFRFLRRIRFPRNRNFYSMTAIFFMLVCVVLTAIINISFAYYFIWAFFWAILFSIFRNRFMKLVCLLFAPVWLFKIGYDIFSLKAVGLAAYLINSRIPGNLLLSAILLPFLLMIIRLGFAFAGSGGRLRNAAPAVLYSLTGGITIALLIYTVRYMPFNESSPQPVLYRDFINMDAEERNILIESPSSMKGMAVLADDFNFTVTGPHGTASFLPQSLPVFVEFDRAQENFLGRNQYTLWIRAAGTPARFSLSLLFGQDVLIYDCGFPFTIRPEERKAVIHVGDFPPNPLRIDITLPVETPVEAVLETIYTELPYTLRIQGDRFGLTTRLKVAGTYKLQ
ncbi:MAG: hypothetical protein E4H36_01225 [Spirochaetales bacterium]|nr:MAG: hypothetical protein E4H36_01225 [Spirochaetales bacterium]